MPVRSENPRRSATLSRCGRYRYDLVRPVGTGSGWVLWVMLNPSTADAELDDPTIRRCMGFGAAWGFGHIAVVNLLAWRETDPRVLLGGSAVENPIGPRNDATIAEWAGRADRIVAAWGAWGGHPLLQPRVAKVRELLRQSGKPVHCLGLTREGQPRHPVRLAAATRLVEWATANEMQELNSHSMACVPPKPGVY